MKVFPQTELGTADEGLLDSELSSEDPITAWLGRYLTPADDKQDADTGDEHVQ